MTVVKPVSPRVQQQPPPQQQPRRKRPEDEDAADLEARLHGRALDTFRANSKSLRFGSMTGFVMDLCFGVAALAIRGVYDMSPLCERNVQLVLTGMGVCLLISTIGHLIVFILEVRRFHPNGRPMSAFRCIVCLSGTTISALQITGAVWMWTPNPSMACSLSSLWAPAFTYMVVFWSLTSVVFLIQLAIMAYISRMKSQAEAEAKRERELGTLDVQDEAEGGRVRDVEVGVRGRSRSPAAEQHYRDDNVVRIEPATSVPGTTDASFDEVEVASIVAPDAALDNVHVGAGRVGGAVLAGGAGSGTGGAVHAGSGASARRHPAAMHRDVRTGLHTETEDVSEHESESGSSSNSALHLPPPPPLKAPAPLSGTSAAFDAVGASLGMQTPEADRSTDTASRDVPNSTVRLLAFQSGETPLADGDSPRASSDSGTGPATGDSRASTSRRHLRDDL